MSRIREMDQQKAGRQLPQSVVGSVKPSNPSSKKMKKSKSGKY